MFKSVLLPIQEYNGPMFGGDFNCALEPQLERSLISAPGRHDSLALQQILSRVQLSAVLDDDMEIAEEERAVRALQAASHTYSYTLPGGNLAIFTSK